jgi:hypothetical protein
VDEYDKPLLNLLDDLDEKNPIRAVLKGFYGILKSAGEYLRFVFLTGVTKFTKVSIFSDLNHLSDISLDGKYAAICGITEAELTDCFKPEINKLAETLGKSYDQTLGILKKHYNGYHFSKEKEGVYNPFSLLNTFMKGEIRDYWFETGTPTFLVTMLKNIDFDLKTLEKDVFVSERTVTGYRVGNDDPTSLLYQTGYLTIKSYNKRMNTYCLGFPNEEVKYGFIHELLPAYMQKTMNLSEFFIGAFLKDISKGNAESFMTRLKAFFAGISYELNNREEKDFQTVFYIFFTLLGQFVKVEQCSAEGRADAIVKTSRTVYVFEFKITGRGTAESAMKQIENKGYAIPFTAGNRKIVKIGAEFSTAERGLKKWVIE